MRQRGPEKHHVLDSDLLWRRNCLHRHDVATWCPCERDESGGQQHRRVQHCRRRELRQRAEATTRQLRRARSELVEVEHHEHVSQTGYPTHHLHLTLFGSIRPPA